MSFDERTNSARLEQMEFKMYRSRTFKFLTLTRRNLTNDSGDLEYWVQVLSPKHYVKDDVLGFAKDYYKSICRKVGVRKNLLSINAVESYLPSKN